VFSDVVPSAAGQRMAIVRHCVRFLRLRDPLDDKASVVDCTIALSVPLVVVEVPVTLPTAVSRGPFRIDANHRCELLTRPQEGEASDL
jgi:hypothetical protein